MLDTYESLGIASLPVSEKVNILHRLVDDLATKISPGRQLTPELAAELKRRVEEIENGTEKLIPAEVVRAEARAALGRT